ncbi:hypothetical protein HispidOSU_015201 [Sigmodon hispidus]
MGKENQDPRRTHNLHLTPETKSQPVRDKKLKQHPVFQGDRWFSKAAEGPQARNLPQAPHCLGKIPTKSQGSPPGEQVTMALQKLLQ